MTWEQSLRIVTSFVLAALALSALTFGLVGINRYYDSVWNQSSPKGSQVFTISGQIQWFAITLIVVITGAILLGALALVFPWTVVKGAELKNLWDLTRIKGKPVDTTGPCIHLDCSHQLLCSRPPVRGSMIGTPCRRAYRDEYYHSHMSFLSQFSIRGLSCPLSLTKYKW